MIEKLEEDLNILDAFKRTKFDRMKLIKNTQAIQSPSLQNHNSRESLNQMDRQDSIGVVDLDTKISDNSDLTEAPQITITDINIETNYGIALSMKNMLEGLKNRPISLIKCLCFRH